MSLDDLTLEPFAARHYATLSSWFGDQSDAVQWGGPAVRYPLDAEQLRTMLPDETTPPTRLSWMALRNCECVGHAQAISLDPRAGVARLGRIIIAPAHRGHRLAIPMLRLALAEAFAIPGIERVDLGVYTWNAGAIKTYTRLGFTPGTINRASVRVGDEHWDTQEMSLSREAHPHGSRPTVL